MSIFKPSKYQTAIFDWILCGDGHGVVSAVAGSGKTTTLVEAIKIIPKGDSAVFLAFNKHIADSLAPKIRPAPCVTIHSMGRRCLVKNTDKELKLDQFKYKRLGVVSSKRIYKAIKAKYDSDYFVWANEIGKGNTNMEEPVRPPKEELITEQFYQLLNLIRCTLTDVSSIQQVQEMVSHFAIECPITLDSILPEIERLLELGIQMAEDNFEIDFTDMVWLPFKWNLRPLQYDWVLVDEAQDLNNAQLSLAMKSCKPNGRMLFVGDRRQAIYGFSGADCYSFDKIKNAVNGKEFPLSICYRCPSSIVNLAKAIVQEIEPKPGADEGEVFTIQEFSIPQFVQEGDWILCRWTAPLVTLCIQLISKRIPAQIKGKEIGNKLTSILNDMGKMPSFKYENFKEFLFRYREEQIAKSSNRIDAEALIESIDDRIACLWTCYIQFSVQTLEELSFEIEKLFSDEGNIVSLSTIHRVKGMENNRIFFLYSEKLPHEWEGQQRWEFEQEENLKYIGFTRSTQTIFLVEQPQVQNNSTLSPIAEIIKDFVSIVNS